MAQILPMLFEEGEGFQHTPGEGGKDLLHISLPKGEQQAQIDGVHRLGRENQFGRCCEARFAGAQSQNFLMEVIGNHPAIEGIQGGLIVVFPFLRQALSQQEGRLSPHEAVEFLAVWLQVFSCGRDELGYAICIGG